MRIDVTENGTIRLKEVFNSVMFETEEGDKLVVCMRDGGFEVGIKNPNAKSKHKEDLYIWHRAMNGEIKPLSGKA